MAKLTTEQLIERLNYDLSGELQAIVQYLQHHYCMVGLLRETVGGVLEEIAKEEMKHADELSSRIVALGGTPTVKPRPIEQADTIVEMLRLDLKAESGALKDYYERRDQCEESGEIGTALIIENIIVDEQHHYDQFVKLIRKEKSK